MGSRYRYGGSSPRTGFDCSGFVYYVMQASGISVGRSAAAQYNSGRRVSTGELQPGDMVFFSNTYKRGISHAGIYIGGGKFVHAETEVLMAEMPNRPGAMADLCARLNSQHISIKYAYVTSGAPGGRTLGIFKVDNLKKALRVAEPRKPHRKERPDGRLNRSAVRG